MREKEAEGDRIIKGVRMLGYGSGEMGG